MCITGSIWKSTPTPCAHARAGEVIDLQPGMTATAEILTGSQTVWQYLTKPILKTVSQSMQEH